MLNCSTNETDGRAHESDRRHDTRHPGPVTGDRAGVSEVGAAHRAGAPRTASSPAIRCATRCWKAGSAGATWVAVSADIAFETDAAGCFVFLSPDTIMGWPINALLGRASDLLLPDVGGVAVFNPFRADITPAQPAGLAEAP